MKTFIPILAAFGSAAAAPSGIGFAGYAPTKSDISQLVQSTREIVAQANAIPGLKVVRTGEPTPLGILETTDIGLEESTYNTPYTSQQNSYQLPNADRPAGYPFAFGYPETYEGQQALLKSTDALVKTINEIPGLKVVRTGERTPLGLLEQSDIALHRKKRQAGYPHRQRQVYQQPQGYASTSLYSNVPISAPYTTSLIPAGQDINDLLNSTKDLVKMVNDIPGLKVVRTNEATPLGLIDETDIGIDTRAATAEGSTWPYTFTAPTSPEAKEALLASTDALVETVNLVPGLKVVRTGEKTPLGLLEKSTIALY